MPPKQIPWVFLDPEAVCCDSPYAHLLLDDVVPTFFNIFQQLLAEPIVQFWNSDYYWTLQNTYRVMFHHVQIPLVPLSAILRLYRDIAFERCCASFGRPYFQLDPDEPDDRNFAPYELSSL